MKILQSMCRNVFEYRRKAVFSLIPPPRFCSSGSGGSSKLKILFFGTDHFSLPSLRVLTENWKSNGTVQSIEVVTSFKAKKNPLKQFSKAERLPLHDWPLQRADTGRDFDLGVVVSFGHLIPEVLITSFRLGMLNVHASLLPKLRGAAPIVHAIARGQRETGVTIMRIRPRHFDVGEILAQRRVPIGADTLMPELHGQLAEVGAAALMDCVSRLDESYAGQREQDDREATYAPKITPQFADIRWREMTAREVYDRFRALHTYRPLTTRLKVGVDGDDEELVKIFKLSLEEEPAGEKVDPGRIVYCRKSKRLRVGCSDGALVDVEQLAIGGKKAMSAQEFYNGFLSRLNPAERMFRDVC